MEENDTKNRLVHRECHSALHKVYRSGSNLCECNTRNIFYMGLVEGSYHGNLGSNLGIDDYYLTRLFKTTFSPGSYEKSLEVFSMAVLLEGAT